ncbi:molecular chaperone TorD family protein [[Empedobacter] haloabium]|uniref:Molecular chaperone TorD family protein n=1 Tax=[Empedobacter] haloabium TaxID=592317 RepID=A0ABZ1URF6_9BURK
MNETRLQFETPDSGEEAARAELYGLLSMLFYQAPDAPLLAAIAAAPAEGEGELPAAWRALQAACAAADPAAVRDEYDSLFVGTGKPEVFLYGSYYMSGFLMEKPLALLRVELAKLGLERSDAMPETEDHIAALCDVMRVLITSDDVLHGSIATQRQFFGAQMQPWVQQLCDAVAAHAQAHFYRHVAALAGAFFAVEMQAFDMS